jgi:two-component system phosphate regulon sensor histidine kinase PhoR
MAMGRFLPVIVRQADRLNAIVEDLLMLARVEHEHESEEVNLARGPILPVLRAAADTCQAKADAKRIQVHVHAPTDLTAMVNATLLAQAVVNLLDNAIKYCPAGSEILVTGQQIDGKVELAVADNGPGIDDIHLPRLFERFYRPDKARSREVGGTGLGLAIVKHVAKAHGGEATVTSTKGKGSIFRIQLPAV